MNQNAKRPAIYLEPELHEALRCKATATNQSVSALVNQAVREALREDQEDLSAFEERASEPTLSYEEVAAPWLGTTSQAQESMEARKE